MIDLFTLCFYSNHRRRFLIFIKINSSFTSSLLYYTLLFILQLYPEYYDVIETPVDLKTVARKIQEGVYNTIGDMEKDLMLMCRNACHFNEPGSQIYKDAKLLKRIITAATKKQDSALSSNTLKATTTAPSTRSKRGNRSMTQSLIAQTAALPDEDYQIDDEEEESAEIEEADNPQWQLFQTIRTAPNNQG